MSIRVLIADDHRVMRDGLRLVFSRYPDLQVVGEAVDGADVLRQVEYLRPDVVLLDVLMPVLDGIVVARRLQAEYPDVRVVVLTMDTDPDHIRSLIDADIAGFVMKAGPSSDVVRAIRAAAQGEVFLDQVIAQKLLTAYRRGRAEASRPPQFGLTDREHQILCRLAHGESNKEIARTVGITEKTVRNHLYNIFSKLGVADRTQAVLLALRYNLCSNALPEDPFA